MAQAAYDECLRRAANPADCTVAKQRVDGISCPQAIQLPPISVNWFAHDPDPKRGAYSANDFPLIIGGSDYDQNSQLFVCQAFYKNSSTGEVIELPGKLLKGLCNVAYNGWGTETSSYDFAVRLGAEGYWATPSDDMSHVLRTARTVVVNPNRWDLGEGPTSIICSAEYITKESMFGFLFPHDVDHGRHIGRLVGDTCHFERGGARRRLRPMLKYSICYLGRRQHLPAHIQTRRLVNHPPFLYHSGASSVLCWRRTTRRLGSWLLSNLQCLFTAY